MLVYSFPDVVRANEEAIVEVGIARMGELPVIGNMYASAWFQVMVTFNAPGVSASQADSVARPALPRAFRPRFCSSIQVSLLCRRGWLHKLTAHRSRHTLSRPGRDEYLRVLHKTELV